jgi:hypothetical protein
VTATLPVPLAVQVPQRAWVATPAGGATSPTAAPLGREHKGEIRKTESLAVARFTPGPQALKLLQQAAAAGLYFPNEQQMEYYLLADLPFDSTQFLELCTEHLAPQLGDQEHQPQRGNQGGSYDHTIGPQPCAARVPIPGTWL